MTLKFADMGKNQVRYRLLVEGKNDQHIIWNLAQRLGLKETFEVVAKDSYSEIITVLPTELKSTNTLERLGVIVDADVNIDGHWQAIRNILLKSGFYEVPECLPKEGLVCQPIDPEQLVFGVWIMPNNHLKGMVEDFIIQMIPDTDNDRLLKKRMLFCKNLKIIIGISIRLFTIQKPGFIHGCLGMTNPDFRWELP